MTEIWKDILGYEGYYQVSNLGRVKRIALDTKQNRWKEERCLHYNINNGGYYLVGLCVNNKPVKKLVHRLVWEAFNGPIPEGMQVNHIDEDKSNNTLGNLNLLSCKDNIRWGSHIERATKPNINGKLAKRVFQYTTDGVLVSEWLSIGEIKRRLGYDSGTICNCCNNRKGYHTAYGFKWSYCEDSLGKTTDSCTS